MDKVIFSSWAGKIVDNRRLKVEEYAPVELAFPLEYDHSKLGALMGWDGLIVADEKVNVVDMAYAYTKEVHKICCGECAVGRIGVAVMVDTLSRILEGRGEERDIELLQWLANGIKENAKCVLGQTAPIPILDSIRYYEDEYLDVIKNKKAIPKSSYKVRITAPCMEACPVHLDIPGYIELIKNRRYSESLELIRDGNCLPGVCGRVCTAPCENSCKRKDVDGHLAIRALKRYVADWEIESGLGPLFPKPRVSKEKVAVIGAGPAGLACAYNLALKGYQVVIFEELPLAGGMAAVGIPQYRLPKDILNREINIIKGVGVEIKLNTKIGRDLTVEDLWKEGYKAVFIAVGAHEGSKIGAEGEERGYEGFVDGVKFLRDANLEKRLKPKNKVLIVGGGDVAIDCARTCLRAGFKDVNIVYRRSRAEMPARKTEVEEAEEEGVKISFLTAPAKILGNNGNVAGAECIRMELGALDVSGRRRPIPIKGSEFIIEADLIISAVGQQPDLSFLAEGAGVNIRGATIEINDNTCQTSREGIFAGGDCVTGPATVIDALAAGNKAARSIDQYIREGKVTPTEDENTELAVQGINLSGQREMGLVGQKTSEHIAYVPVKERACNFREVEFGFSSEAALNEAKRCLRCYRVMLLAMTA